MLARIRISSCNIRRVRTSAVGARFQRARFPVKSIQSFNRVRWKRAPTGTRTKKVTTSAGQVGQDVGKSTGHRTIDAYAVAGKQP